MNVAHTFHALNLNTLSREWRRQGVCFLFAPFASVCVCVFVCVVENIFFSRSKADLSIVPCWKVCPEGNIVVVVVVSHLFCKHLIKLMKENCQLKLKEKRKRGRITPFWCGKKSKWSERDWLLKWNRTEERKDEWSELKWSKSKGNAADDDDDDERNKATYKSFRSQLKVLLRFPNVLFKCIKLNGDFESDGRSGDSVGICGCCVHACCLCVLMLISFYVKIPLHNRETIFFFFVGKYL